jgi:hypothetical protein
MHLSLSFTDLNMDAAQAEKIIEAAMQWLVNATQEWQEARLLPGGQG